MNTQRYWARNIIQYPKKVETVDGRKPGAVLREAGMKNQTYPYEVFLDKDTVDDTRIYVDMNYITGPQDGPVISPLTKPFDVILYFICNNCHDRTDFGADVTVTIGGKKSAIKGTSVCYIPAGFEFSVEYDNVTGPTVLIVVGVGTNDFKTKLPDCPYDALPQVEEPVVSSAPYAMLEAEGHDFGDDGYIKNHTCPNQIYLGDMVTPGFPHFSDITWFWDIPYPNPHVPAHTHKYDELIIWGSSDPHNNDLDGEVMFYVGEEPHFCTRSCALWLPAGLKHCPMIHTKVNRPMFLITLELGSGTYTQ